MTMFPRQSLVVVLLFVNVTCLIGFRVDRAVQDALTASINETMSQKEWPKRNGPTGIALPNVTSAMHDICHALHGRTDFKRLGCCQPQDSRQLINVKIEGNSFLFFGKTPISPLPSIRIVTRHDQPPYMFSMSVQQRSTELFGDSKTCPKGVFDGTLHVFGRSLAHNVYHATVDNFLPLIAQIVMDSYLSSPLLYAPRMFLSQLQGPNFVDPLLVAEGLNGTAAGRRSIGARLSSSSSSSSSSPAPSPHMALSRDLFSAGHFSLRELDGVCFRRVVWGGGLRALYHNSLVAMRRFVTDLARAFVMRRYELTLDQRGGLLSTGTGAITASTASTASNRVSTRKIFGSLNNTYKSDSSNNGSDNSNKGNLFSGRRVVLFTRSSAAVDHTASTDPRSLANEAAIVTALNQRGALATLCCDFSRRDSWIEQLSLATHADVIVGLHGAALVHGIFAPRGLHTVELKIHYGYNSALFALVTDSRVGIHSHLDARGYNPGGGLRNRPVDAALVDRVVSIVTEVAMAGPEIDKIKVGQRQGQGQGQGQGEGANEALLLPAPWVGEAGHVLGPATSQLLAVCRGLDLFHYQTVIGSDLGLHCAAACKPYVDLNKDLLLA